jgi:hypothetical protein
MRGVFIASAQWTTVWLSVCDKEGTFPMRPLFRFKLLGSASEMQDFGV